MKKVSFVFVACGLAIGLKWWIGGPSASSSLNERVAVSVTEKMTEGISSGPKLKRQGSKMTTLSQPAQGLSDSRLGPDGSVQVSLDAQLHSTLEQLAEPHSLADASGHWVSAEFVRQSLALARVRQTLVGHPERAEDVAWFYASCSDDSRISAPHRAICVRNLIDLISHFRLNREVAVASYPMDVRRLVESMPSIPF